MEGTSPGFWRSAGAPKAHWAATVDGTKGES